VNPPKYFQAIAASATKRWQQLDADPVLKAPWLQLFAQVQSPRHVLSELLQNADDAGAKSAHVCVRNDEFVFEHDGQDFSEEQFQSLCQFGFSNKRNLHTIGFRGIGFKSTFSLGRAVRIQTPTLDITFERERFTLPNWSKAATATPLTRISVPIADKPRLGQIRKNFEDWATSPASLLFFRNLQELTVESQTLRKQVVASGPVAGSQRIRLVGAKTEELLLIRSDEEPFPADVINEIGQERIAEDLNLPPCRVDLVLGLDGQQKLFVVLPTGASVALPFAVNAPFLQDPGRFLIKEPEISPCNRWLLERAGKLAAKALVEWIANDRLSIDQRAQAYSLLRRPVADGADLSTSATKHVMDAMLEALEDEPILLTTDGKLAEIGECISLPAGLHRVWEPNELTKIFTVGEGRLLAPEASRAAAAEVLEAHGWIEKVSTESALQSLTRQPVVPKPPSWAKLQLLWEWVEHHLSWDYNGERRRTMRLVPAEGESLLHPANDIIRVSSRRDQLSDDDWNWISNFALAVDREWIAHLGKLKSRNDDDHSALRMLQDLGLHEPSSVDRIAAQASRRLLARGKMPVADCVRITQIFAALDASVPDDFRYVTEDCGLRSLTDSNIVFDQNGIVEALVPKAWAEQHLLHSEYTESFTSCTRDRWFAWAYSAKSRLRGFVPFTLQARQFTRRGEFEAFVLSREGQSPKEYRFRNDHYIVDDLDFPPELYAHWRNQATNNPKVWAEVARGLLLDPLCGWKESLRSSARQKSAQHTFSNLSCGNIAPGWLVHLRSVACLTDTHDKLHMPPELLLRTPETETLIGLEPFVAAELDDSADKKRLLKLLHVRETTAGWEKIVERLRALAKIKDPMRFLADVLRLYEALDRISMRCSGEALGKLRAIFSSEGLILSNELDWLSAGELSLHADPEDDSPVVHSAAHGLALWLRLGVPERPALEKGLEWLKTLDDGSRLDGAAYKRATLALARGGRRVWEDLGHWLSLDQTWEPIASLQYRVSMRSLTRWEKLSPSTKRASADLRMLPGDAADQPPFTVARNLNEVIAMRVTNVHPIPAQRRRSEWIQPLAEGLSRVKLSDESVTAKVRAVAQHLLNTTWQTVSFLEVTPYIDGVPAGEPLMPKVLWSETTLFVADQSTVRLYRDLKEELARPFGEPSVMDAVAHCIDRDAEFVREYLAANFELDLQLEIPTGKTESSTDESGDSGEKPNATDEEGATGESTDGEGETEPTETSEETPDSEQSPDGEQPTPPPPKKPAQPKDPTFMDRYAKSRGFRWRDDERCYTHANGSWIERGEAPFSWHEHADGTGVTKRLFVAEETLVHGVEIPYELWRLMEINPDSISLVLAADDGQPCEWSATDLHELKTTGQVYLHQSRFILKGTT